MTYIFIGVFIIIYIYGLLSWDKKVRWRLKPKISKAIKYLHFATLLVCLTVLFLYSNFNLGLRGLWTTRVFIIVTLLTGIFFIIISDKTINSKLERIYFEVFSYLPIITGFFLYIPFLGIVLTVSLFGQLTSPADKIYYDDKAIRVQSSFVGILGPPVIDIFQKKGILEKHIYHTNFSTYDIDSLQIHYDSDSTRIVFYSSSEFQDNKKVICLDKVN